VSRGVAPFFNVLIASLSRPLQLSTLGVGLVLSIALPSLTIFVIPLALVTVGLLVTQDIGDDSFVKNILSPQSQKPLLTSSRIQTLINQVETAQERTLFQSNIQTDLVHTKNSLLKIQSALQKLEDKGAYQASFISEFLPQVVQKILDISNQQIVATEYLATEDSDAIETHITRLEAQLSHSSDPVSKQEYTRTIELKRDQLRTLQTISNRLTRLNSYSVRIQAILEQSYGYLTTLNLQNDQTTTLDESEILVQSLQQISSEVDDL
jgi:hypothetical protein